MGQGTNLSLVVVIHSSNPSSLAVLAFCYFPIIWASSCQSSLGLTVTVGGMSQWAAWRKCPRGQNTVLCLLTLPRNASIQNGRRQGQKQRHLLMSMLCHYHSTFSKIMSCTATLEQTKKNELKFGEMCIIFLVVKSKKTGRICYLCLYVNYGATATKGKKFSIFHTLCYVLHKWDTVC